MDRAIFNQRNDDTKMFDAHKKIHNAYELAYYLDMMLEDDCYSLSVINDNQIYGIIDGVEFEVEYYGGNFIMVKVEAAAEGVERCIKRALKPVMWNMRGKDGLDETITYIMGDETCSVRVSVWDFDNPEATINEVLNDIALGKVVAYNIESKSLNKGTEELLKRIYYGTYIDFLPHQRVLEIDKYSEFELFFSIKSLQDEMDKAASVSADTEEAFIQGEAERRLCNYFFHYLVQQSRKFGVRVNPPAMEAPELSPEFKCWMSWWGEAFERLTKQDPDILEKWKSLPGGYDAQFRPAQPFERYLEQYMQALREKEERARMEIIRQHQEAKIRDEQRRKTLNGRFETLLETIKTEAEELAKGNGNDNPFGDFGY